MLDRFVEMYGQDAVIPVARTGIGNIALSGVQFEPELFRCMAFKGAEIICRVATGGFEYEDMRLTSYHNSLYTLICNNSVSTPRPQPGLPGGHGLRRARRSAIFGPRGVELAKAGAFETRRSATIPIAEFRRKHRIPDLHMSLYRPVLDQYRERYDPNGYAESPPESRLEAYKQFAAPIALDPLLVAGGPRRDQTGPLRDPSYRGADPPVRRLRRPHSGHAAELLDEHSDVLTPHQLQAETDGSCSASTAG